jgi:hypothetical protein
MRYAENEDAQVGSEAVQSAEVRKHHAWTDAGGPSFDEEIIQTQAPHA